jgi:hypothetical protein
MKREYDFSKGKRGAVVASKGKTRITIFIDSDIIAEFRERADKRGVGYQTLMNEALRAYLAKGGPLTEESLRNVLREEMPGYLVKAQEPAKVMPPRPARTRKRAA